MLTPDQLYQVDKYKVHLGNGAHIGFCTVWNEPEIIMKRAPVLAEKCAIIGTLYGRQGVSIIVRNLALNPQIRRLYVWGFGPLSQTSFGRTGTDILFALWNGGVADDNTVNGTKFKLEKEIDPVVVRTIIAEVELIDISTEPLETMINTVAEGKTEPYMAPVRFPDAVLEAPSRFPSEVVGWILRGRGVVDAWLKVVRHIMLYGAEKGTQYGMRQRELIGVTWVITAEDPENPVLPDDWPEELRSVTGAAAQAIRDYFPVITSPVAQPGTTYTYGNRLKAYPMPGGGVLDQIADVIIKQFKSSPDSRRTVATTMVPPIDWDSKEPPCLTQVQCLQSDGNIHLLATFRSHDIFKAAIANAFGLRALQQEIATACGFQMGYLQITSQSAHIYEPDWGEAKKLIACSFTEREPNMVFKAEDADPRGNITLRVTTDGIEMTLMGPDGSQLMQKTGKSARYLQAWLSQMEVISQIGHALDVGMELQKAQIALEKGIEYTQDRPLKL